MSFIRRYATEIALTLLTVGASVVANPWGEFPVNDEGTYALAVKQLLQQGKLDPGTWTSSTLLTNILAGAVFCLPAGFSFFALRCSGIVALLMCALLANRLTTRLSGRRVNGFLAGMTIVLNPLCFATGNSFMTDIPFLLWVFAALYASVRWTETPSTRWLLYYAMFCLLATFSRQLGLVAAAVLPVSALLRFSNEPKKIVVSLIPLAATAFLLYLYESYLRNTLPSGSAYQFVFGGAQGGEAKLSEDWQSRPLTAALMIFFYAMPCILFVLSGMVRTQSWTRLVLTLVGSLIIYSWVFSGLSPLTGNMLTNCGLGPDTFYENLTWFRTMKADHTTAPWFDSVINTVGAVAAVSGTWWLLLFVFSPERHSAKILPLFVFMFLYLAAQLFTPANFDRYYIPMISVSVMVILSLPVPGYLGWYFVCIPLFAYVALAGTRDYFQMNRERWNALNYLRGQGVDERDINAGYEPANWRLDGKPDGYYDALSLDSVSYVIQYTSEEGFAFYKAFPFRRLFPPCHDTVFIFRREIVGESSPEQDSGSLFVKPAP